VCSPALETREIERIIQVPVDMWQESVTFLRFVSPCVVNSFLATISHVNFAILKSRNHEFLSIFE